MSSTCEVCGKPKHGTPTVECTLRLNARFYQQWHDNTMYVAEDGVIRVGNGRHPSPSDPQFIGHASDNGVILGMPNDSYHAETVHISSSSLKQFLDNPYGYYRQYAGKRNACDFGQSTSKLIGSIVHAALLDDTELSKYRVEPEFFDAEGTIPINRRRTDHKEFLATWESLVRRDGFTPISGEDFDEGCRIADAVTLCSQAHRAITHPDAQREVSLFVGDSAMGVRAKVRIDLMTMEGMTPVIWDIKTSTQTCPDKFAAIDVPKFGYDLSAAMYRRVVSLLTVGPPPIFRWIVLAKDPKGLDHQCYVVRMDDESLMIAADELRDGLRMLAASRMGDKFVSPYAAQENVVRLPNYKFRKDGR